MKSRLLLYCCIYPPHLKGWGPLMKKVAWEPIRSVADLLHQLVCL